MAITLCIETSGPHCSLALARDEHVFLRQEMLHRTHNEHLLGLLDALFKQAGCTPQHVDVIGFGCGPGSFTGVRIAAAATQAIALAAQARVVAVSSSWALAATAVRETTTEVLVTAIASRGQAYYLAAYEAATVELHAAAPAHDDELCEARPDWLQSLNQARKLLIVGAMPAWLTRQAEVVDTVAANGDWQTVATQPCASVMVPWVRAKHAAGESMDPAQALPRYIHGDSPWRKRGQS